MAPNVSVTPKPLPAPKHAKTMQTHLRKKFVSSPPQEARKIGLQAGAGQPMPLAL